MRVDIDFGDAADKLAAPSRSPKFGYVYRVTHEYELILPWLQQLERAGLDGNMRVYRAGTDFRIMPPYHAPEY